MKNVNNFKLSTLLLLLFSAGISNAQTLVKDIRPGQDGCDPFSSVIQKGNTLYFLAEDAGDRLSIFKTDATTAGTQSLISEQFFYTIKLLGLMNNDLLFIGGYVNDTIGTALYKINVNTKAISLIKDINKVDNDPVFIFGGVIQLDNGSFLFYANDGVHGYEPWITDGTNIGTKLLKDINPSGNSTIYSSTIGYFAKLGNSVIFGAAEPVNGAELWKTDGTTAGTVLIKDIEPGVPLDPNFGSNPSFLTAYNGKVYFSANTTVNGRELWVTDGTANGTQLVKDLAAGDSYPQQLTVYNGNLYFIGNTNNDGVCLYKSDGTAAGTNVLRTPANGGPSFPSELVIFDGKLYSNGADLNNQALFSTTGSGFTKVIIPDEATNLLATSNFLYFGSYDLNSDYRLYRNKDTTITKLTTSTTITVENKPFYFLNGCLVFEGDNGSTGIELFSICGLQGQPLTIDETNLNSTASIYPNPTNGRVTVNIQNEEHTIKSLSLYSIDGKLLFESISSLSNSTESFEIPSQVETGYYLVVVKTNDNKILKSPLSVIR